ncbi:RHS repeat-associated core domain-containing protein [Trinickia sp.]|uniref:RHS repeat-associated core domain-containing protein n=1 Tax=Trinickia sp. TaxID=2571163 RepID=UPI003F80870B
MLGTVNLTCDPFKETFSNKGSTLHHLSSAVSALAALQGAPSQLLNTGIAQIPLLDKMPGMPAATIGAAHLGTPHAHDHPPSDGFPLPSVGATIGSGCLSVLIGGMPAARVMDMGIAPTCGGLTPYFDIQTGSSNTFIGGMRAARMGIDMTRHCNPMGHAGKHGEEEAGAAEKGEQVASEAAEVSSRARWMGRAGKAWNIGNVAIGPAAGVAGAAGDVEHGEGLAAAMMAAQTTADAAMMLLGNLMGKDPGIEPSMGVLLDGNPTVLIGGFPMPDSQMMWHGVKHGIGKKVRARRAARRGEVAPCRDGHPVDVVKGTAENEFVDYETKAAPAFKWERYYCSGWREQDGALGFGFRHAFQHELRLLRTRAVYVDALNGEYPIRRNPGGRYEGVFAGYELVQRDERRFVLRNGSRGEMMFERGSAVNRTAKLASWVRDGVRSTLEYARNGALLRIAQEECPGGRRQLIELRYDGSGHLADLYLTDPQGQTKHIAHYRYDAAGCLVAFVDSLGAAMTHGYDDRRRMVRETDANGYSFSYRYDSQDRCVESGGQDGLWHVALDYQPGRTVVTRADGGKWTFLFDEARTVTRIVDPYGGAKQRVTGEDGRILREIDSGGRVMHWLYDARGLNTGRMDRWGNRWPTMEDALALPNPLAHTVPVTPLALQWGEAEPTMQPESVLLPPEIQRIAESLFPQSAILPSERHDARGRVVARIDEYGGVERFLRDAVGNVIRRWDKDGRLHHYGLVSWNLRESETDPLGNTVQYRYSNKQEITTIIDANGNESAYAYDDKGRIARVMRHGVVRETYAYDAGDRLIEKRDGAGNPLLVFEVGEEGLQNKRILATGETHSYEYDRRGKFTRASTEKVDVKLAYDVSGRRTSDKRNGRGVEHRFLDERLERTTYFGRYVVHYDKGPAGDVVIRTPDGGVHRLQRAARDSLLLQLGNGTNALFGFDQGGRCTGRVTWPERRSTEIHCVKYRYGATGELRSVIDSKDGTTDYQYDDAHRLVGETRDRWPVSRFEYDRGGNLLSTPTCQWMRYTEGNRLSSAAYGSFRYNSRNHVAEEIDEHKRRTTYRYNSLDLLVQVEWSDRQERWTAEYDGLCRRIAKAMGQARTQYFWDGDRLAAEVGSDGRLRVYVYVNELSYLPFMFIDYSNCDADPGSGNAYYVFGNQVGLPERIEDEEGRHVWRAEEIQPYGSIRVATGNAIEYDLRWPGHWFDIETGLHYNRFRSYHPGLGRYLQSDPAGQSGGINLYAYTSNPLVAVDVLGLAACPLHENEPSSECPDCESKENPGTTDRDKAQERKNKEIKALNAEIADLQASIAKLDAHIRAEHAGIWEAPHIVERDSHNRGIDRRQKDISDLQTDLRKSTPTTALTNQINRGVRLGMDDPALPGLKITKRLHADHIVSFKAITNMDGFWDLTVRNQLKVLNYEENFVGLSEAANESKGSKTFEEWTRYEKGKVDVDPEFRKKMMEEEKKLRPKLQQYIDQLLHEQRAR